MDVVIRQATQHHVATDEPRATNVETCTGFSRGSWLNVSRSTQEAALANANLPALN